MQIDGEGGIINDNQTINEEGNKNGGLSDQGTINGSGQEAVYTGRESQMGKNNETINGYVTGGKGEILSGSTGKTPRRIRINHTKNSSVTFTEGSADGTDGYKAYTAFANVGIKAIYCQGPIERTVNGVTVTRTEAFTAPDGTEFVLDKEKDTESQSARVTNENEGQRSAKDSVSNNKLTQPEPIVKNNISVERQGTVLFSPNCFC